MGRKRSNSAPQVRAERAIHTVRRSTASTLAAVGLAVLVAGSSAMHPTTAATRATSSTNVPKVVLEPITVFVGGYGPEGVVRLAFGGGAEGSDANGRPIPIIIAADSKRLLRISSPTFLLRHPTQPVLYVTSELGGGSNLRALRLPGGEQLDARSSGGKNPVRIAVDMRAERLAVANYDGSIALFALKPDGRIGGRLALTKTMGSGPVLPRQSSSHPHSVVFTGDGSLVAADLGADAIVVYALGAARDRLEERQRIALPPGTGPRQVVPLDGEERRWVVVGELASTLVLLARNGDGESAFELGGILQVEPRGALAEALVHPNGRWLVLLNRGPDECIVFDVASLSPPTERLRAVARSHCQRGSRHAVFDRTGEDLLVAAVTSGGSVSAGGGGIERIGFFPESGQLNPARGYARFAGAAVVAT